MKQCEVSVLIPTYNSATLLSRALESVLAQTVQDFEIIIIDDGSSDQTLEVVKEFQKRDLRIFYLYQANSGGAAKPKNVGISTAKGTYIAVLDADDEWLPQKLEKQLSRIKRSENSQLGFVGCHFLVAEAETEHLILQKVANYNNVHSNILARDYMGPGSCILYKRTVFDKVGLFDENLKTGQDWEMRIRLAQFFDFEVIEDPLVIYYLHDSNISKIKSTQRELDRSYIFNKYKFLYKNNWQLYSDYLRYQGTQYMLSDQTKKGRLSFLDSIKMNPQNIKSYAYLLISLLGSGVYKKLQQQRLIFAHTKALTKVYED